VPLEIFASSYSLWSDPSSTAGLSPLLLKRILLFGCITVERDRSILIGHIESFQWQIGDLLGIKLPPKADAFQVFHFLGNLYPEIVLAERLSHVSSLARVAKELHVASTLWEVEILGNSEL
jgi:hypothetical protein